MAVWFAVTLMVCVPSDPLIVAVTAAMPLVPKPLVEAASPLPPTVKLPMDVVRELIIEVVMI